MKFGRISLLLAAVAALGFAPFATAQEGAGKKKLALTKIAATEALQKRMAKQGVELSLDSVLQALDSQVYDRLLNTRRFEILERSDADALAKESAAAGERCGSRPLPEAVTRSTGTGAGLPGSAARSASLRAFTAPWSAGFEGPRFEAAEAAAL